MRVGLVIHARREDAAVYAHRAVEELRTLGAEVWAETEAAELLRVSGLDVPDFSCGSERMDVVLSLGGDGTLLRGAQYALRWNAALLGINLGRLGFLAETERNDMEEALRRLVAGSYTLESRPVLTVHAGENVWHAVNDVVVCRGRYTRLIVVDASVDGVSAGRYVADGVIVATPTGSTGYSLSAGGPIVSPNVDCLVLTPICAHSLQHRPTVVQGGANIRLALVNTEDQSAALQIDGQARAELKAGQAVDICRDKRCIQLIRMREGHFYQLVRDKLSEWTR